MSTADIYLSTTIPYVNAAPHLGHALEFVQADVLARHHRAARRPGPAADRHRRQLAEERPRRRGGRGGRGRLRRPATPPRSRRWRAARAVVRRLHPDQQRPAAPARRGAALAGLRRGRRPLPRRYEGLYCVGCEQFYRPDELDGGRCPEHGVPPQRGRRARTGSSGCPATPTGCARRSPSGRLRIEPAARRNEVLAFIAGGLETSPSPAPGARPAAGASPCPATRTRSSTSGGTRSATTSPASATAPDERRRTGAGGRAPAGAIHLVGKGVAAVPRRLLAGDAAVGRAAAAHRRSSCTTT